MAASAASSTRYLDRPSPSGLADVVDLILDKGLVIDIYLRVSLVGIELLTVDARIVVASVDTYLRFAEAVNRLDLRESDDSESVPELMESAVSGASSSKTKGALDAAQDKLGELLDGDDEEEDDEASNGKPRKQRRRSAERARERDEE